MTAKHRQIFCSKACLAEANAKTAADKVALLGDTKVCTKCTIRQPFSEFSPHKLGVGGVRSICKQCSSKQVMAARAATPESRERSRVASRSHAKTPAGSAARVELNRRAAERDPARYMLARIKSRAKRQGLDFDLTVDDIKIPDVCPVFGVPMQIGRGEFRDRRGGGFHNSMSVDRIRIHLGYVKGNVAVISWRANRIKSDCTLEELEAIVRWMREVTPRPE